MFAPVLWEERLPALERMRNEFETLFHRFFPGELVENKPLWEAALTEKEKEFVARMEMPGFEVGNILIEVLGERLHVKAERKPEKAEETEWRSSYERYLTLPAAVLPEKAEATYRNGMLEVHLPKAETAVVRRIPVT